MDIDPKFGDLLLAKIFIDTQGNLKLATWPIPQRDDSASPPMRLEVLLTDVETFDMRFYRPPRQEKNEWQEDLLGGTQYAKWVDDWPNEAKTLPVMLKIMIHFKDATKQPVTFAFFIDNSDEESRLIYHE